MQPLGDFFPNPLHFRPAGAFLFRFPYVYFMVFTGDGWVYCFPPCRASPRIGFYFLGGRTFPALYRPPWFVKKKRLPGITEQLFRRTAKPLKQKQVIPPCIRAS
jgi:hypothetical protein